VGPVQAGAADVTGKQPAEAAECVRARAQMLFQAGAGASRAAARLEPAPAPRSDNKLLDHLRRRSRQELAARACAGARARAGCGTRGVSAVACRADHLRMAEALECVHHVLCVLCPQISSRLHVHT